MNARAPRILMLGTAPEGRGGVAALVSVLRQGGLFEREAVDYVSTHREGGFLARLVSAACGFWLAARACQRHRPRIMHAHAASNASFVRKSSLLEAMACSKAVVASAVGAVPEALRDGENGLLVPPRDAAALATALARLLADGETSRRLGDEARSSVERHYSTEAVCGRLAAIYNDLAGVG